MPRSRGKLRSNRGDFVAKPGTRVSRSRGHGSLIEDPALEIRRAGSRTAADRRISRLTCTDECARTSFAICRVGRVPSQVGIRGSVITCSRNNERLILSSYLPFPSPFFVGHDLSTFRFVAFSDPVVAPRNGSFDRECTYIFSCLLLLSIQLLPHPLSPSRSFPPSSSLPGVYYYLSALCLDNIFCRRRRTND